MLHSMGPVLPSPALPAGGWEADDCLPIILIENAHPSELAGAFLGLPRGYDVHVGSVMYSCCSE